MGRTTAGRSATGGRQMNRRQFLIRAGVLGAVAAAGPDLIGRMSRAAELGPGPLFDAARPVLQNLARDTISGLIAMVVPGEDAFSVQQGHVDAAPGGLDARGPEFMMDALDHFFPIPDEYVRGLLQALATGMADSSAPLPDPLAQAGFALSDALDDALAPAFTNDEAMPLSIVIAGTLNQLAVQVDPSSLAGPFLSPFANLAWEQKLEAFRVLEEDNVSFAASLDADLPEPMTQSLSGLFAFVAGALVEFAAFGSYSEWGVFDPGTRSLTATPVGWTLSRYLDDTDNTPVHGWDESQGYFQGRRAVLTDNPPGGGS